MKNSRFGGPNLSFTHLDAALDVHARALDERAAGVHVVVEDDGGGHDSKQEGLRLLKLDPGVKGFETMSDTNKSECILLC